VTSAVDGSRLRTLHRGSRNVARRPSRGGACPERLVVAMVTDAIHPFHRGGKETRTRQLATRLARSGVDVHVFTMNWWGGASPLESEGVTYHALCRRYALYRGRRRSILEAVMFAFGTCRLLGQPFDVLEVDHMPHLALLPTRMIAWLRRVPLVSTWHEFWGSTYWREYLGPLGTVAGLIERLTLRLPDQLVTPSPETAERLVEEGVARSKVTVVPNGIDLAAIDAAPSAAPVDVIFVGRLLAHKNVDLLLESLALLRAGGTVLSCVIVGQGPERSRLEAMVRDRDLSGKVRFLENLDDGELYGLMKSAKLFVLPSVREGFGIVVAEAMACGLPVVTTRHPDNHARVLVDDGETGWLCDASVESLTTALLRGLEGGALLVERDRLSLHRFDWDRSVSSLIGVFERSLGAARQAEATPPVSRVHPA
jgi:glycosyltransferase involved in cell wall biosynthesis